VKPAPASTVDRVASERREPWSVRATPGHTNAVSALALLDDHSLAFCASPAGAGLRPLRTSSRGDAHSARLPLDPTEQLLLVPEVLPAIIQPRTTPCRGVTSVAEEKASTPASVASQRSDFVVYMETMKLPPPPPHRHRPAGNLRSAKPRRDLTAGGAS